MHTSSSVLVVLALPSELDSGAGAVASVLSSTPDVEDTSLVLDVLVLDVLVLDELVLVLDASVFAVSGPQAHASTTTSDARRAQ
jgi:hypothetical protein